MGQAKSESVHLSARRMLDTATTKERGVRISFPSRSDAERFRFNCYAARDRERKSWARTFDPSDPLHGKSPWEEFEFLVRASRKRKGFTDLLIVRAAYLPDGADWAEIDEDDLNFLED